MESLYEHLSRLEGHPPRAWGAENTFNRKMRLKTDQKPEESLNNQKPEANISSYGQILETCRLKNGCNSAEYW